MPCNPRVGTETARDPGWRDRGDGLRFRTQGTLGGTRRVPDCPALGKAPKLFSWADTDGDGQFSPAEFKFHPDSDPALAKRSVGDYTAKFDYLVCGKGDRAFRHLPVAGWEGPSQAAPRWDWDSASFVGKIVADSLGFSSPRGLSIDSNGLIALAYQSGVMIKGRGQQ